LLGSPEFYGGEFPSGFEIRSKNQIVVGLNGEPAIGLDFLVELTRRPACIAQREQAAVGPVAVGHGLEDIDGCGQRHIVVNDQRRILDVIRRMQDKTAAGFHRATEMNMDAVIRGA
jgi:hypothetical protein